MIILLNFLKLCIKWSKEFERDKIYQIQWQRSKQSQLIQAQESKQWQQHLRRSKSRLKVMMERSTPTYTSSHIKTIITSRLRNSTRQSFIISFKEVTCLTFFNSDFQKTVRAESDPFNKEFLQIIRRYQTSFNVLNKPKSENAVAAKEEILSAPFVAFMIEIVPLCTREEFKNSISESIVPVGLPHDCLELQISFLKAKYQKGPQFLVKNKEINIHLRLLLEDLISKLFVALYQKPNQVQKEVSNGKHQEESTPIDTNRLFPFLKQLENVLHQLVRKAISRQLEEINYYESRMGESDVGQEQYIFELGEWMKPEDLRLEHAVRLYKQGVAKYGVAAMAEKDQWAYISEIVESKNPEQCKNMCLKIAQQEKQKLQPVQGGAGEEQKQEGDGQEERKAQDGPNIHTETPEIKEALGIVESFFIIMA